MDLPLPRFVYESHAHRDALHRKRPNPRDQKAEQPEKKDRQGHVRLRSIPIRAPLKKKRPAAPSLRSQSEFIIARSMQAILKNLDLLLDLLKLAVQHALVFRGLSAFDAPSKLARFQFQPLD